MNRYVLGIEVFQVRKVAAVKGDQDGNQLAVGKCCCPLASTAP